MYVRSTDDLMRSLRPRTRRRLLLTDWLVVAVCAGGSGSAIVKRIRNLLLHPTTFSAVDVRYMNR